jgi:protein-S-isoprenylcysteine O-methyltransferase Ste14
MDAPVSVLGMTIRRGHALKTLCVAAVLHGVFTMSVPWLLLRSTRDRSWASMPSGPLRWIGLLAMMFGVYLYLWALVRLLARGTSALPGQRPTTLETAGWYSHVRHPLLLGVVLILMGEAVLWQSAVLLAYAVAYWTLLNAFVVLREEPELQLAFGEAYTRHCSVVPRWIPRFGRHARATL